MSLWWAFRRNFGTSRTRTFSAMTGSDQYQFGTSLAQEIKTKMQLDVAVSPPYDLHVIGEKLEKRVLTYLGSKGSCS